ncbi:MAG: autotransporter domain-containing protein [Pseudolabrys sp.]|nr:autotransporter domain-containing protein [Pseudolabrys sp.]MDP2298594.1 autotransporter domain-containing protein [Pseudolabrys sp.]
MSSTAIASLLVLTDGVKATEATRPVTVARQKAPDSSKARSTNLSSTIENELRRARERGKQELVASLFDTVWREPRQRDAALEYARTLAPAFARDLATAADLGALLTGRNLTLAPNAAQVIAARSAAPASAYGNSPVSIAARANNTSPNLPSPLPTAAQQTVQLDLIHAQAAYARGYTGAGVTVAVGDSGFDTTNQALVNKFDLTRAKNFVINTAATPYDPDFVGIQSLTDQHGTHVSGIIAAAKFDNVAMHGIAYDAGIVPIRLVLAGPNSAPLATYPEGTGNDPFHDALTYAASLSNVMVYNASYGPNPDDLPALNVWSVQAATEINGVYAMMQAGKLLVVATGNERGEHPIAGLNPSGIGLYPYIKPAHANTGVYDDGGEALDFSPLNSGTGMVIAVTSVGAGKEIASYANMCGVTAGWCVAAPGGNMSQSGDTGIYSTVPVDTYGFSQGTSMAAPAVSGALAVLIQAYPTYAARDLANLLFSTTEDLGDPGVDGVFGRGLIRLDRATDGPTTLAANTTVAIVADTTTYWSQPLTTSGAFTKDGDGILTIAGRTGATGKVDVARGTLAVDGTLTVSGPDTLNVNTNGTLAGFGVINGNTVVDGILSPGQMPNIADLIANNVVLPGATLVGNSAGVLTFNGNVTLSGGATTRIDIDGNLDTPAGPRTFDRIVVSGAGNVFTANGTLTPILRDSTAAVSNYTPAIGSTFAFVQATNGAQTAGTFATLTQPVSGLPANGRFDLIYAPAAITLSVTPLSFAGLSDSGLSEPGRTVAGIIDAQRPAPGVLPSASTKALYDALYALTSSDRYATALTQLGGPGVPAVTGASMFAFQGFMGSIGERQDALASGAQVAQNGIVQSVAFGYGKSDVSAVAKQASQAFASVDPVARSSSGWSVWAQGFGRWSNVGDAGGLSGSNSRSGGFTVGADTLLAPDLIGGMALGFARTTSDASGTRATADSYTGALYASWTPGRAVYDLRVAAGPTQIRTSRDVILAPGPVQGDANGFGGGASFEAGYRIPLNGFTAKPYAGIAWQGFRRDGYTETQAPFGLAFPSQYFEKITTTLGVAISRTVTVNDTVTVLPEFKLGWGHDLRDTSLVSQAALLDQAFSVSGAAPGRDAALIGLKLSGWTQSNFRLFTAYNGEFRSNATSHQLSGGARYTW